MKTYPVTNAQKRIWFAQRKYTSSPLFNIGGTVKINGNVNVEILRKSIYRMICNNAALKLKFFETDTGVLQYIDNELNDPEFIDFSSDENPSEAYENWSKTQINTPFYMENCLLYYFAVFKLSKNQTGYFVKMHHIISDGWSMKLLTEQIAKFYESDINNIECEGVQSHSFIDILSEEEHLSDKAHKYWMDMLTPLPENTSYTSQNLNGIRKVFLLDGKIQKKIEKYISLNNISLNMYFVMIYYIYTYKTTGNNDIIIGLPFLGRTGRKERQIFGNFTNTMPFRYQVDSNDKISDLITNLSVSLKKSYQNQKYPYNILKNELKLEENGIDRLFDVCINYYNTVLTQSINNISIENNEFYSGQQDYAMQIIIRHWNENRLQLDFDFQTSKYSEKQISDMYDQLLIISDQIIENSELKIKDITLLKANYRQNILFDFNDTKKPYPLNTWIELFDKEVLNNPCKKAVSQEEEYITYSELKLKSNGAAEQLINLGVENGDIIAAILNHNIESIILITAIAKCGAIYLPIDPKTPENRIKDIIRNSKAEFLIASSNIHGYKGIYIDPGSFIFKSSIVDYNISNPFDIAYIIYTSGSTGNPKGVMVRHRNLLNYLWWAKETYIKSTYEVFSLYSSFAFDFTMTSVFLPLISGGEIRIFSNGENENIFSNILNENISTIVKITPSHIPLINDVKFKNESIHTFIVGGESLSEQVCNNLYIQFDKKIDIYNEYGPTETTIGCMTYLYNEAERDAVPVGKPISNTQIYLLDNDLQPVPDNITGEIYISGDCVSKGYLGLKNETAGRFIKNPFLLNEIMYKTGDIAYRNDSNDIVYLGRNDSEVKIRGYRVNLSEIESKALLSKMISDIVIRVNENKQICAYIIKSNKYNEVEFKSYLTENLPDYMIPQFIIQLDKFPLTVNGKVNYQKLPEPLVLLQNNEVSEDSDKLDILLDTIKEVVLNKSITAYDNFYAIGGDSIKAIQISSRLIEKGYEINVRDILTNPIIREMTIYLSRKTELVYEQGLCMGNIERLPVIDWFFEQDLYDEGHYNQSIIIKFKHNFNVSDLKKVFSELISHHDILRLNYDKETKKLYYNNEYINKTFEIIEFNMHYLNWKEAENEINSFIHKSFDLAKEILMKLYKFNTLDGEYLYIVLHHLITDGVSWRIIIDDISNLLQQIKNNELLNLPSKSASYQVYSSEVINFYKNKDIDVKFWESKEYFENNLFINKNDISYNDIKSITFEINKEDTDQLLGKVNETYNTKTDEILLTAFAAAVKELYGENELVIEIESHGRNILDNIDVNRTVGWFTNIFPVHIKIDADDLHDQIMSTKDQIRKTTKIGHEYGALKYVKKYPFLNTKHIRFNYLGEYIEHDNDCFEIKRLSQNVIETNLSNKLSFIVEINAIVIYKRLTVNIVCGKEIFNQMSIFTESYKHKLQQIIRYTQKELDK